VKFIQSLLCLAFVLFNISVQASTPAEPNMSTPTATIPAIQSIRLDKKNIPSALKAWVPWVMHGHESLTCPHIYNQNNKTVCAWATKLSVNLRKSGGRFTHRWRVFAPSWLRLPGSSTHWPQNVKLDGRSVSVTSDQFHNPVVFVKKGRVKIDGDFNWSDLPETLALPPNTGIVSLTLNGKFSSFPVIDQQHRLWLSKSGSGISGESDKLEIQVFRKITDNIPMNVETHLILKVTGKQREITLGPMPVNYFIPQSLNSQLPAQIDSDGKLRIQVRPGVWRVNIVTRSDAQMEMLTLRKIAQPWPEEELWVFEARNHYRLVDIQNQSIDSRQTNVPDRWKMFPAYLMKRGDKFNMATIRRGNPEPEPDQLNLTRSLWLDFDGKGYTFKDNIHGTITSGWRLETQALLDLGRVNINGEPQFITRLDVSGKKNGVEVRSGQLELSAEGRIESKQRTLPVTGWDKEFSAINTQLNMPPGWSVFYALGTDNQPDTFVQRWSLLDLFLVLVISVAIGRMWSWKWGVVALLTMTVIWHEPNAPHYTWLNLLIAIALVKVFPENKFSIWIRSYRHLSFLLLVVLLVPFSIQQARLGLHPQLASDYAQHGDYTVYAESPAELGNVYNLEQNIAQSKRGPSLGKLRSKSWTQSSAPQYQAQNFNIIDPNATIQTGFGLPSWSWKQIDLSWKGPVVKQQEFRLILIPPGVNRSLHFLRIAFIGCLLLLLFGFTFKNPLSRIRVNKNIAAVLMALSVLFVSQGYLSSPVLAEDIPDAKTLNTLRDKILMPPNCLPHCAHAAKMHISVNSNSMQIRLQIHTQDEVAVPLPGNFKSWSPSKILVGGSEASALRRDANGILWIRLSRGVHNLNLHGPLPELTHFTVELPLIPKQVTHKISGWHLDGVHQNGRVDSQLQFSRNIRVAKKEAKLGQSSLPAFVYIERTLRFGIDWTVETRVIRASPIGTSIVLKVPILRGETVTSDVNLRNDKVIVNMSPQQKEFVWHSELRKAPSITLRTSDNPDWFEIWRADISPIWHVVLKGIAPVSHYDESRQWLPEWHPWPSERVNFGITRPIGITGKTVTIDNSQLNITTSKRASAYKLEIRLRSSLGGRHQFVMPDGTELQSVKVNNRAMPIRLEQQVLNLPITPGKQLIEIEWRQRDSLRPFFLTPKVKLGVESTNSKTLIEFSRDRWILFTGGPQLGPAVLFWGVLVVLLFISIGLGFNKQIPLKSWHWFLLAIGLTQVSIWTALVFLASFYALAYRQQAMDKLRPWLFNTMQIGIAFLMFTAGIILIVSIHQGLLGSPDMQIAGYESAGYHLKWYADRVDDALPQPWIISVPLILYRALMLAWALWLALAVIRWSKWGWQCYSTDGLWKSSPKPERSATVPSLPDKPDH